MNITTMQGHMIEIAVLVGFLCLFAIPVVLEARKKARAIANAPRQAGATKI